MISIIAAVDELFGIGIGNELPWRLKGDMEYFKAITTKTDNGIKPAVIMGRKTWESIPKKFRPLEDRGNIVISRNLVIDDSTGAILCSSLEEAMYLAESYQSDTFIIGGSQIYEQTINDERVSRIYLTKVQEKFACDSYFPEIPDSFKKISESEAKVDKGIKYTFNIYER